MSGSSSSQDCPRCGGVDTVQTYSDWRPYDQVEGFCRDCGFAWQTNARIASLAEVNEVREDWNDNLDDEETKLPILTQLAKPVEEWLKWGQEPRPEGIEEVPSEKVSG